MDRALERFLSNDAAAVEEIRGVIEGVVRAFHVGHDQAPDLIQEALTRLTAALREERFQGASSLKTYAQSVAKYTCLEFRRSRRQDTSLNPDSVPSSAHWSAPDRAVLDIEEHRKGLEAFASLPEETRRLFLLIFIEELSYREVSARLGISEGATKSRIRRLRDACRRLYGGRREAGWRSARVREGIEK
ncbi:MAG: RNA polymerase sigma factor [Candidatus Polarisedimenticolia bacterium]